MKAKRGKLVHEPYGVIGIIAPWNYPFSTPALEALQALATGNAVVLKPSEFTPLVAKELERMFLSAGLDPALLQVVVGEGATGAALLESPIDKLIFTGSVATGKRVGEAAARRLLPVVLELGGKDPMLVLDDANLEVASSGAVWFAFMNAGQTCLSLERCYVHRSLYEPFLQKCKEKIAKLRVGNGIGSDVEIGPMIHERQLKIVETQVDDAVQPRRAPSGRRRTSIRTGAEFLRSYSAGRRDQRHAASCRKKLLARFFRLPLSTATKKRSAWRTTATSAWPPASGRRTEDVANRCRAGESRRGDGQRHDLLLRHCRSAARWL